MKLIKEYDDALETPVCDLIEQDVINGIRSKIVPNDITGLLSDDIMFPYAGKDTMEINVFTFSRCYS
jgi:hypothetical protein